MIISQQRTCTMNGSPVVDMKVLKKRKSFMDESCKGHMT